MFKTRYLRSKYYKLEICDTTWQLVTPFLCIHLHKLKFESLNWSTIGCEAAASWGWIFMKYLNITTAMLDPGHSVAPDTGERSSCQPFHLSSRRCFGLFTTQPTLHHPGPGGGASGGGYFGRVPVLTFVWPCCCCCSGLLIHQEYLKCRHEFFVSLVTITRLAVTLRTATGVEIFTDSYSDIIT